MYCILGNHNSVVNFILYKWPLMSIKAAKYFDPMFFDTLIDGFIFIEVRTYLSLREQVYFSVFNWPPWRVFSDSTLKSKCWRDIDICEDSISSNSDFAVLGVCISEPGVTNHWTKSMVCSLFGRTEHPRSLSASLGAFPNIFPVFLIGMSGELGGSMALLGQHETQLYNCALPEAPSGVQQSQVYLFHLSPYRRLGLYLSVMAHPATRWDSLRFKV